MQYSFNFPIFAAFFLNNQDRMDVHVASSREKGIYRVTVAGSVVNAALLSFPGVSEPHHLRTRRIGSYCAVEMHVRMDGQITLREAHDTATAIEDRLKEMLGGGTLINIHVEPKK